MDHCPRLESENHNNFVTLELFRYQANERELCCNLYLYLFCCQFTKLTAATSKSCYIVIMAASELSEIEHWLQ